MYINLLEVNKQLHTSCTTNSNAEYFIKIVYYSAIYILSLEISAKIFMLLLLDKYNILGDNTVDLEVLLKNIKAH